LTEERTKLTTEETQAREKSGSLRCTASRRPRQRTKTRKKTGMRRGLWAARKRRRWQWGEWEKDGGGGEQRQAQKIVGDEGQSCFCIHLSRSTHGVGCGGSRRMALAHSTREGRRAGSTEGTWAGGLRLGRVGRVCKEDSDGMSGAFFFWFLFGACCRFPVCWPSFVAWLVAREVGGHWIALGGAELVVGGAHREG
jgi:hypothetical protein